MNFNCAAIALLIKFALMITISNGFYIKTTPDIQSVKPKYNQYDADNKDEWSVLKQKLGLSNQKIDLLKSQKDQQGTLKLLKRFIEENPNYNNNNKDKREKNTTTDTSDQFEKVYHNLQKQLRLSSRLFKTSLNFEFSDKPRKDLKRSRRKIAVKMVSDMSSEKIDDLLKIFNEKHGVNNLDKVDISEEDGDSDNDSDLRTIFPSARDPDYVYENLYEDEEDLAAPAKSNQNSQYGSLQDLILQASRNRWKQEIEETKLWNGYNEHFI